MKYIGESVFDNLDGNCMCPFEYIEEYERNDYRNNPPYVVQEMRLDEDVIYCSNEHHWNENPNPKDWKYSSGMICVGIWKIKYKYNGREKINL